MDQERFGINKGRQRPPYKPQDIHCADCGAGLTIKDEHTELVVCEYCGSHLDVSKEEKTVLGKGSGKKWEFPLQIGDSFRKKNVRYEIIGRMAFIEDGDYDELTRQYLLYNPRCGSLWLDEYQGEYSISTDTHVMPASNPFAKEEGDIMKTHDNRKWVMEESGTYELVYVDGALPWIAKVGDRIDYVEFSEKGNSKQQYDAQRIENEIEYGRGEALSIAQVRQAIDKPDMGEGVVKEKPKRASARGQRRYGTFMLIALLALLINGGLAWHCMTKKGNLVLDQQLSVSQQTARVFSVPFQIVRADELIQVVLWGNLGSAGINLSVSLVDGGGEAAPPEEETQKTVNLTNAIDRAYIKIPEPGTYRLKIYGSTTDQKKEHYVRIQVLSGVLMPYFFIGSSILALGLFVIYVFAARKAGWIFIILITLYIFYMLYVSYLESLL